MCHHKKTKKRKSISQRLLNESENKTLVRAMAVVSRTSYLDTAGQVYTPVRAESQQSPPQIFLQINKPRCY